MHLVEQIAILEKCVQEKLLDRLGADDSGVVCGVR